MGKTKHKEAVKQLSDIPIPESLFPKQRKRDITIKCPVHQSTLSQADITYIRSWYCDSCSSFYLAPDTEIKTIPATIHGHSVKMLPDEYLEAIKQEEKKAELQMIEDLRFFNKVKELRNKFHPISIFEKPFYTQPLLKKDASLCSFCGTAIDQFSIAQLVLYLNGKATEVIVRALPCCRKCHATFLMYETYRKLLTSIKPRMIYVFDPMLCKNWEEAVKIAQFKSINRQTQQPPIPKHPSLPFELPPDYKTNLPNISLFEPGKYIWLYATKCHCHHCEKKYKRDTIRNRTALVQTISGTTVKVNVEYCAGCGEYFMNAASLKAYNQKYGCILAEFYSSKDYSGGGWDGFDNFNPDSVLSRCGYNVRQGTPKEYRQQIIAFILNTGKASKYRLLELLESFINVHWYSHPAACKRWQEDVLFINDFEIQKQEIVTGLTFKRGK